jgi:hypothetical protein
VKILPVMQLGVQKQKLLSPVPKTALTIDKKNPDSRRDPFIALGRE